MDNLKVSAGVFFYASSTSRFLFLLRNDLKNLGYWGLPGGKINDQETLLDGIARECIEEMNYFPKKGKLIPIQKFVNNNFVYHTFFCKIKNEFIPKLNKEHKGYCWVDYETYPKPLHPGLFNTVNFDVVQSKIESLIGKAT